MKHCIRAAVLVALMIGAFGALTAQAQRQICLPQSFTSFQDSISFCGANCPGQAGQARQAGQVFTFRQRLVFDLPNQRQRFDVYQQLGSKIMANESVIQDFIAGVQYEFNTLDKVCYTRKIQGALSQRCLASNAQLNGTERIISLITNNWAEVFGIASSVNVRLANTNIPTDVITRTSDSGVNIELFTDFVSKVNATDFTVPSYCVTP